MTTVVAIVGYAGAYGRWLGSFFSERMACTVLGTDPSLPDAPTPASLLARAEVLVFATPIRQTPAIIADYVAQAGARSRQQLWLDITSIKSPAVAAMLQGPAEVVGLHPMCAAPKTQTLRGRVLVVCEARLERWRGWFDQLLAALEAQTTYTTPAEHDRVMALVQGLVHAGHLAQAQVLATQPESLRGLAALLPYRSPSFAFDTAMISRLLISNPSIYEDIQFLNPHVPEILEQLAATVLQMAAQVRAGDSTARQQWRQQNVTVPAQALGNAELQDGNTRFEHLAYLLADLAEPNAVVMHLPKDEPGQLRQLLGAFAEAGVNLHSLHSSRDGQGRVLFRVGLDRSVAAQEVCAAIAALARSGTAVRIL